MPGWPGRRNQEGKKSIAQSCLRHAHATILCLTLTSVSEQLAIEATRTDAVSGPTPHRWSPSLSAIRPKTYHHSSNVHLKHPHMLRRREQKTHLYRDTTSPSTKFKQDIQTAMQHCTVQHSVLTRTHMSLTPRTEDEHPSEQCAAWCPPTPRWSTLCGLQLAQGRFLGTCNRLRNKAAKATVLPTSRTTAQLYTVIYVLLHSSIYTVVVV